MKRHLLIIAGIAACISMANAQLSDIFKYKNDIGKPWNLGSYVYNPREQSYLLRGAGYIYGLRGMSFTICITGSKVIL